MTPFAKLSEPDKKRVMEIVAQYHYRTGEAHNDGSRGVIKITPGEFNNVLADIIMEIRNDEKSM